MARKNLKLREEVYDKAAEQKDENETWSEFINHRVVKNGSETHRETSPEQAREAVREVLREEATRDLLSTEIDSVVADRLADDIESTISQNPPKEAIREVVTDILHSEGITSSPIPVDRESHDDLVEVVKTASSREWVNNFLDMAAKLIEITGVTEDDDQLVMSVRTDQKSLPISLGNRYCLKGYLEVQKVGVILPHGSTAADELRKKAVHTGQFNGEPDAPYWYKFSVSSFDEFGMSEYRDDWERAVRDERERGHRRVRGDAHKPAVYHAAIDSAYRQRLLDDAGFDS